MTENQKTNKFYQKMGVCPMCRKTTLIGEEKFCPDCRAIKYTWQIKWRKEHPNYNKEKRRELYQMRSEMHLCTYCGIQLTDDYRFKMCPKCLNKTKMQLRRSRAKRGLGNGL